MTAEAGAGAGAVSELHEEHAVADPVQPFGPVGFVDYDVVADDLYVSPQALEILGTDTPTTEAYLASVHPDDLEAARQVLRRARAQPGPYRLRFRSRDVERLIQVRLQSIPGPDGTPVRILGVVDDATAEQQLERAIEERASARQTGLLAGGAVHDLKNIFAVLLGHAQLAVTADDRGERPDRESLEALQRAARNGLELTQQLLHVGRPEPIPTHRVDVPALLRRLASTARTALGRQHQVHVDPGPERFELLADEARLERAIVDLLLNARDAVPDTGGTVQLCFRSVVLTSGYRVPRSAELPPGTYGMIDIVDDGAGIDPDVLARVTDPFFTTKGLEGSGVGLHSVARFVETAGGALQIDSAPGVGTRVRMVVPGQVRDEATTAAPVRHGSPPRAVLHGPAAPLLTSVRDALEARDVECLVTTEVVAALNALRTEPVTVLVVDDRQSEGDARLLRIAASLSIPVLGLAAVEFAGAPSGEAWVSAVADAVDGVLDRTPTRRR